jgi:hypothetical protein
LNNMRRLLLLLMFGFVFVQVSYGQDQLTGRVYENKTKVFLQGVRVENLKTHAMLMTSTDGSFSIKASVGDLICFTNYNYKPDTLYLTELRYVQVFLDPRVTVLNEVNVTNQQINNKSSGFGIAPEKGVLGSSKVLYQTDSELRPIGGLKLNFQDGKDTQREHETKVAANEKQKNGILKVFNSENLKKYLPISGQEMDNFIILYMPDASTFYDPAFNLVAYLNGSFEEFNKIPVEQRQSKELTQLKSN